MPTLSFPFSGGVDGVPPYGQKSVVQFGGTWVAGEWWQVKFVTTGVPDEFWTGAGYLTKSTIDDSLLTPTACYTYQKRVYLAMGTQFNFSAIDDETGAPQFTLFEIQNPGAGFVLFTSQYGNQDICKAFSQLQGRLAVIGGFTIQLWTVSANPEDFALNQILDNSGTDAVESPQNIGDYDAFYLDRTGVRNLKTHMDTLNSYVDDLGIAIDELVQIKLQTFELSLACSIVDPIQKSYWIYVGGTIYVLSRYIGSKIIAWSTFEPRDNNGTVFAPEKFVTFDRQIYSRTAERYLIQYGGPTRNEYDGSVMTVEIPWLDDTTPKQLKMADGIDAAMQGQWIIRAGMDPESWDQDPESLETVHRNTNVGGTESKDSTFDKQHISYNQQGTHFKIIAQTSPTWDRRARISELLFHYNKTK